jgi:hypothetical protein
MRKENIDNYKTQPFGDPDGTLNDLEDIMANFVLFHDEFKLEGLALDENNRKARVLVGRKGSGKTVQLRRLHASALKENSIYVEKEIEYDTPPTSSIIKFCQWFDEPTLTEAWMKVWRAAFFQVIFSHLYTQNLIPSESLDYIKKTYKNILPPLIRKPFSVYSRVDTIISTHNSVEHINKFLNHELWQPFKKELLSLMENNKPMFFYIDAIDDEFSHAPMYWLRCQKGGL